MEEQLTKAVAEINASLEAMKEGNLTEEKVEAQIQEQMKTLLVEGKSLVDYAKAMQTQVDALEVQVKTHDSRFIQAERITLKNAILAGCFFIAIRQIGTDYHPPVACPERENVRKYSSLNENSLNIKCHILLSLKSFYSTLKLVSV